MRLRLFRDPGVAEAATADPISIMASSARLIQPGDDDSQIPVINTQTATQATQQAPTETGKGSSQAEQKPADTKPPVETKPAATTKQSDPPATTDWREVLKQQPSTEVLKAMGLDPTVVDFVAKHKQVDPKISKLVDHWAAKGNVQEYFEALSTDFTKMTDEDVMKRQLNQEIKDLGIEMSKEEFDDLYRTKVIEQYKLDPDMFSEKEAKTGRAILKLDAQKARKEFLAKQEQYMLATPPERQPSDIEKTYLEREKQNQSDSKEYVDFMTAAPEVKSFIQSKILKIGEGDEAYNYEVKNPLDNLDILFDAEKLGQALHNKQGEWDSHKHLLFAAFVHDMDGFLAQHAAHHQEIGKNRAIEPLESATRPAGTAATKGPEELDPATALARNGVLVTG